MPYITRRRDALHAHVDVMPPCDVKGRSVRFKKHKHTLMRTHAQHTRAHARVHRKHPHKCTRTRARQEQSKWISKFTDVYICVKKYYTFLSTFQAMCANYRTRDIHTVYDMCAMYVLCATYVLFSWRATKTAFFLLLYIVSINWKVSVAQEKIYMLSKTLDACCFPRCGPLL